MPSEHEKPLTAADLGKILAEQQAAFQGTIAQLVDAFTAEKREKQAKEAETLKRKVESSIKMAQADAKAKKEARQRCGHARPHPNGGSYHLWRSPLYRDDSGKTPGYIIPRCLECGTELPPIIGTENMKTEGVNLQEYRGLDLRQLVSWHKQTMPNCDCGECKPVAVA